MLRYVTVALFALLRPAAASGCCVPIAHQDYDMCLGASPAASVAQDPAKACLEARFDVSGDPDVPTYLSGVCQWDPECDTPPPPPAEEDGCCALSPDALSLSTAYAGFCEKFTAYDDCTGARIDITGGDAPTYAAICDWTLDCPEAESPRDRSTARRMTGSLSNGEVGIVVAVVSMIALGGVALFVHKRLPQCAARMTATVSD